MIDAIVLMNWSMKKSVNFIFFVESNIIIMLVNNVVRIRSQLVSMMRITSVSVIYSMVNVLQIVFSSIVLWYMIVLDEVAVKMVLDVYKIEQHVHRHQPVFVQHVFMVHVVNFNRTSLDWLWMRFLAIIFNRRWVWLVNHRLWRWVCFWRVWWYLLVSSMVFYRFYLSQIRWLVAVVVDIIWFVHRWQVSWSWSC